MHRDMCRRTGTGVAVARKRSFVTCIAILKSERAMGRALNRELYSFMMQYNTYSTHCTVFVLYCTVYIYNTIVVGGNAMRCNEKNG